MRYIFIVTLFLSLVSYAKKIPAEKLVELKDVSNNVNSEKPPAGEVSRMKEFSGFSYIGLTLGQAQAAAGKRNDRFRVVKRDGIGLPVTLNFVYGRINAEMADGLVVSFSVEGGGSHSSSKLN